MLDLISQTVKATYEGNVLRLHQSLPLGEQQRVWVIIVSVPEPPLCARETHSPDKVLRLAAQVYENLSPDDVNEIEHVALDRSRFFSGRG